MTSSCDPFGDYGFVDYLQPSGSLRDSKKVVVNSIVYQKPFGENKKL
jgi:hypothetical protein